MRQALKTCLRAAALGAAAGGTASVLWAATPDAEELLEFAVRPPAVAYQGRVLVSHWFGGRARAEEALAYFLPPNHYRWEFLSPGGRVTRVVVSNGLEEHVRLPGRGRALAGDAVKSYDKLMTDARERALLHDNYRLKALPEEVVAGRSVWVLELEPRGTGKPHQRFWIDRETGLVLENRRFRPDGSFTVMTCFTRFDPGAAPGADLFQLDGETSPRDPHGLDPDFLTLAQLNSEAGDSRRFPTALPAGFEFESADLLEVRGRKVRHLRYTDGLAVVSLFETDRPVRFREEDGAGGASPASLRLSSAGNVMGWASGGRHYTLMGDVSDELLERLSTDLR